MTSPNEPEPIEPMATPVNTGTEPSDDFGTQVLDGPQLDDEAALLLPDLPPRSQTPLSIPSASASAASPLQNPDGREPAAMSSLEEEDALFPPCKPRLQPQLQSQELPDLPLDIGSPIGIPSASILKASPLRAPSQNSSAGAFENQPIAIPPNQELALLTSQERHSQRKCSTPGYDDVLLPSQEFQAHSATALSQISRRETDQADPILSAANEDELSQHALDSLETQKSPQQHPGTGTSPETAIVISDMYSLGESGPPIPTSAPLPCRDLQSQRPDTANTPTGVPLVNQALLLRDLQSQRPDTANTPTGVPLVNQALLLRDRAAADMATMRLMRKRERPDETRE